MDTVVDFNHVLKVLLDFGELMLSSGGEVNRVEDAVTRLGHSYGAKKMYVFVITSNMTVTIVENNETTFTQSRRMNSEAGTDFSMLETLNSLSRKKCEGLISDIDFEEMLNSISNAPVSDIKLCVGSMIAAGSFALFFGGTFADSAVSVLFGAIIYFLQCKFRYFCPNTMIFNLLSSFIVGIGISVVSLLFGLNADKIMIGDIMLMIPGIAFTNSIRNILIGDTVTGVMRLVETVLWAAALALGFTLSIILIGG